MSATPRVGAVLVTHDSADYLEQTLASIDKQSSPVDIRIAVDDYSTDASIQLLTRSGFDTHVATTSATDTTTRIAQNFHQGIRLAQRAQVDIVVLGDHDDLWHRDRVEHQVDLLQRHPNIAMLASDGFLIDALGAAIPGTIRSTFPLPEDFNERDRKQQVTHALRHSIATGGACALRLSALRDWSVPPGWLHDRWWSLAALRANRFLADATAVIDYRLSPEQEVGLDTGDQQAPARWFLGKAKHLGSTVKRVSELSRLTRTN